MTRHRFISLLLLAVAVAVIGQATPSSGAPSSKASGARKCKIVVRKIKGKKRHVKVCPKRKPKLPSVGTVVATIDAGQTVYSLAFGEGAVWATQDHGVIRIDPSTNTVARTIAVAPDQEYPALIAVGYGSLWASNFDANTVMRFDAATGNLVATIPVGNAPEGIAIGPDSVWVTNHHAGPGGTGSVMRINPATNTVIATIPVGAQQDCCGPQGIAATSTGVWTTVPNLNSVVKIDPLTNQVVSTTWDRPACGPVVASADQVWVASGCDKHFVSRLDPATNKDVTDVSVASLSVDLAMGLGYIWVAAGYTLDQIDPQTNRVVARQVLTHALTPGEDPIVTGVAVSGDSVWVAMNSDVLRIRPARTR